MRELLFFGGFLAGMTVTALVFLWDGRIKIAKKRMFREYRYTPSTLIEDKTVDGQRRFIVSGGTTLPRSGEFDVLIEGQVYHVGVVCDHLMDTNLSAPAGCLKCGRGY